MDSADKVSQVFKEVVFEFEALKDHLIDDHGFPEEDRGTNLFEFQLYCEIASYRSFIQQRGLEGEYEEFNNEVLIDISKHSKELDELERRIFEDEDDDD